MRAFVISVALASLVIPAVMADPAPTQSSAQLEQSAPAAPAPDLASQQKKAAANEAGKAQATAQLDTQTSVSKTPDKDDKAVDGANP